MQHFPVQTMRQVGTVALATLLILLPALWNGFPLVYSDSGTYLRSAFTGFVPQDRPYWYGAFIQVTSLNGRTLWGPVVAQALLAAALLWRCWQHFSNGRAGSYLVSVALLAPFTGLGWYAGQLMPDILTSVGLLAALLFLLAPGGWLFHLCMALLMLLATWTHFSNLLILPLVLGATALLAHRSGWALSRTRLLAAFAVLLAAWPLSQLALRNTTDNSAAPAYTHVFLMGRLIDPGILPLWLDAHCDEQHYGICAYRDSLPTSARAFMWGERSPLVWQGGAEAVHNEYWSIIRGTLSSPRFLGLHVQASLRATGQILTTGKVADELEGTYYREPYSPPYQMIAAEVPHALPAYLSSRQNTGTGTLSLSLFDRVHGTLLLFALAAAMLLYMRHRRRPTDPSLRVLLGYALLAVLLSAWVCGTLSTVDVRFMARTAWILPFVVIMLGWRNRTTAS